MSNKNQTQSNPFRDFYENHLPAEMKEGFISLVCQACDISYNHFYVWLRNPSSIKRPAQLIIANIAGKPVHELFLPKTKIEAWFNSLDHKTKFELKDELHREYGIDKDAFMRHLKGITKSDLFEWVMQEASGIHKKYFYENAEA